MNRRQFEPTNKAARAILYHQAANACEKAGYPGFAEVNREMAMLLTPRPPREKTEEKHPERAPKRKQWEKEPE